MDKKRTALGIGVLAATPKVSDEIVRSGVKMYLNTKEAPLDLSEASRYVNDFNKANNRNIQLILDEDKMKSLISKSSNRELYNKLHDMYGNSAYYNNELDTLYFKHPKFLNKSTLSHELGHARNFKNPNMLALRVLGLTPVEEGIASFYKPAIKGINKKKLLGALLTYTRGHTRLLGAGLGAGLALSGLMAKKNRPKQYVRTEITNQL